MPLVRVQAIAHSRSALPEDDWVNDWHFVIDQVLLDNLDPTGIVTALQSFYNTARSTGNSVNTYLSGRIDRTRGRTYKFYQKDDGEQNFGSPSDVITGQAIAAAGSSSNLPSEVALCLSFRGDLTDIPEEVGVTRPAARRRGRVYLGPFNSAALSGSTTDPSHPATALLTTVKESAIALLNFSTTTPAIDWAIAHAAQTSSWTATAVVAGHVDDAWDTQRRRGEEARSRTLWP